MRQISLPCDIEHVGSTAVFGLGGKGIIDLAIAANKKDIDKISQCLQMDLGYIFRESGSAFERWFFRIDLPDVEEGIRRYHLHLTFPESHEWETLLLFRDYLRSHPEDVAKYAELKKSLVSLVKGDGVEYRKEKNPFFEDILYRARKERNLD